MAGMGKRMRPHTLSVPKPLIAVAGKPIVQHLIEDIAAMLDEKIDEIAFVIGDFGAAVEAQLSQIATALGAVPRIFYQREALGTAHAIFCAQASLQGKVIVAFADTLFRATIQLDAAADGVIWVRQVDDPSAFGVVVQDATGAITAFVEHPKTDISKLAIIGIYYFAEGEVLRHELQYLIDNQLTVNGEYQLTVALENMRAKGNRFVPAAVSDWMDCGNKTATVETNRRMLGYIASELSVPASAKITNSVLVQPCFIGAGVEITNSVVGPHVSLGAKTVLRNSVVQNSIVQQNSLLENISLRDSMIGASAKLIDNQRVVSLSDFSEIS